MSQKTITSFFHTKTVVKKSKVLLPSNADNIEPSNKKLKKSPMKENREVDDTNIVAGSSPKQTTQSLTPDQKQRIEINHLKAQIILQSKKTQALHENIGSNWFKALKNEFTLSYFEKLSDFLTPERSRHTVYPAPTQVYSWSSYCDIADVKVVILGQDPYHGVGQAHGLCFSVQRGVPPPPSLVNMYKELENDIPGFKHPGHGFLVGWAKQGVLLLNACLTVRANCANSHKDQGWEPFTDAVIKAVSNQNRNVVFLLWGSYAQKKASVVDKKKHHLLSGPHPSPLSAHRGFFGCKHFSKCNELLRHHGKRPIDWSYLPTEE